MSFSNFFYEHFLKTAVNYETWCRQLEEQGWEKKGEGAYGVAYVNPRKNYIYKMFRPDAGYEFFLKFALANQKDAAVVKLKRIILTGSEIPDGYLTNKSIPNIIAMEKLEPLRLNKKSSNILFNISYNILYTMGTVYQEGMTFEQAIPALLAHAEKQYQEYSNAYNDRKNYSIRNWRRIVHILRAPFILKTPVFRTIYNLFVYKTNSGGRDVSWDLHSGNFMYRPSTKTIVLTDPFCID